MERIGPHIYVNPERSPAITGFNLLFSTRLPFSVAVDGLHLKIRLQDQCLTNFNKVIRESIGSGELKRLEVQENHLTDSLARIVREYPNSEQPCDCPNLCINGIANLRMPIGEFSKGFEGKTRAYIYRGNNRNAKSL